MDRSLFQNSPSGRLVSTDENEWAFVPNPLPPEIDIGAIAIPLANAMQAIGELQGACRRLQDPYMLVNPLQRREALTSSSMEGTHTSADELVLLEASANKAADEATVEVLNYIRALNHSINSLVEIPICHRLIKDAHRILLGSLSPRIGSWKKPGEYRNEQNWIGSRVIQDARFVPPPPADVLACMDLLEKYINREDPNDLLPLIEAAIVHYQFETIHPFLDGNGRVGRMLISVMLVQRQLLDMPVLYLSPYLEKVKDDYIDKMYNVSANGAWTDWIIFFLNAIKESSSEAVRTIDELINLQTKYRETAATAGRSSNLITLVDSLFEKPVLTIPQGAIKLGVTYRSAQSSIQKLVQIGILTEIDLGRQPKYFVAHEVVRISASL